MFWLALCADQEGSNVGYCWRNGGIQSHTGVDLELNLATADIHTGLHLVQGGVIVADINSPEPAKFSSAGAISSISVGPDAV